MKQHSGGKPQPRTQSRILVVFSRIGSFIFHPFFMITIAAFALYKFVPSSFPDYSSHAINMFFINLALFTIVFPFLSVVLFRRLHLISDTKMHERKDRIYPLLTALIFYTSAYWFLTKGMPLLIHSLLLGSCLSIFLLFIVTNFYKVSVHTTAAAILPGVCMVLLAGDEKVLTPLLFASVAAIIVGIVRWLLGAHTIGQILLGYLTGIFTQLGAYYYLR
jgi:hypothetical protein